MENDANQVTLSDTRNTGTGVCFYCSSPIHQKHDPSCVCLTKRVPVRVALTLNGVTHSGSWVHTVPQSWDREMVEFHLNDSSWCASNMPLEDVVWDDGCAPADDGGDGDCLCRRTQFRCAD